MEDVNDDAANKARARRRARRRRAAEQPVRERRPRVTGPLEVICPPKLLVTKEILDASGEEGMRNCVRLFEILLEIDNENRRAEEEAWKENERRDEDKKAKPSSQTDETTGTSVSEPSNSGAGLQRALSEVLTLVGWELPGWRLVLDPRAIFLGASGKCKIDAKEIVIDPTIVPNRVQFFARIIHSAAHALTTQRHGKEWWEQMARAWSALSDRGEIGIARYFIGDVGTALQSEGVDVDEIFSILRRNFWRAT